MRARTLNQETILQLNAESKNFPDFRVGDTISVYQYVTEGDKERIQAFTGDVIASRNNGIASTFTVRKIGAHNVAVERIFPFYSPIIKEIKLVRRGKTRRAQAYYLRGRVGKSARFKEILKRHHGTVNASSVESAEISPEPRETTSEASQ